MKYSEFLKSTGCKDNKHNCNIFIKLVDLYMNSDITQEDIYEFGKKLVDNSESEENNYCEWIKYDYRTIVPREHDINNPYWRIPRNMDKLKLKYCPYCGKEIKVTD